MRIAVVQRPPVLLNRSRTIADAVAAIREVAANGARLVIFPEAHIPGYPVWIWRLRPGSDMALAEKLHAQLLASAVSLPPGRPKEGSLPLGGKARSAKGALALNGDDLMPLRGAAKEHRVTVV